MNDHIEIPRILQDRTEPGVLQESLDRLKIFRDQAAKKTGRYITDRLIDRSVSQMDLTGDAELAFREQYNHEVSQKLRKTRQKIGFFVLRVPGVADFSSSRKFEKEYTRKKREQYKRNNGTIKSELRDTYIDYKTQFPDKSEEDE